MTDSPIISETNYIPSWNDLIERTRVNTDLKIHESEEVISDFETMRSHLGDDWPSLAWNERFPVGLALINSAPWSLRRLSAIGNRLKLASTCTGFSKIRQRLRNHDQFRSASMELDFGCRAITKGLDVEFGPSVGKSAPDLRVLGNKPCLVELKEMKTSEGDRRANRTLNAVYNLLSSFLPNVVFVGRIARPLSPPRLKDLVTQCKNAISSILAGRDSVAIIDDEEEDAYEILLGKPGSSAFNNFEHVPSLGGPVSDTNEITRLKRTITETARRQLPQNEASLMILHDQLFAFDRSALMQPQVLRAELSETVYEHSNLVAVVVMCQWMEEGVTNYNEGSRFDTYHLQRFGLLAERGVIIKNRHSNFEFSAPLVRALMLG